MANASSSDQLPSPEQACSKERVSRANATALRVRDAMVAEPKTLQIDATAGDLRALFENPHVRTALVVDGARFVGVIPRERLEDQILDGYSVGTLADRDVPTIDPDSPLVDALAVLDSSREQRLVVLDGERLCGLLCLSSDRIGFCQS